MQTFDLNLWKGPHYTPEANTLPYNISHFPDGQRQIEIYGPEDLSGYRVVVKSRMENFAALELIVSAVKCLKDRKAVVELYIPYILGGRSDRKFSPWQSSYLEDVIAPTLNNLHVVIHTLDPHSEVTEKCMRVNVVPFNFFDHVDSPFPASLSMIAVPDSGAKARAERYAKILGIETVVQFEKERDLKTGRIVRYNMLDDIPRTSNKAVLVFDDICDGGGTFNLLASNRAISPTARKYLYVTHGIFSKGVKDLLDKYAGIFTTNSFCDLDEFSNIRPLEVINIWNLV